MANDAEKAAAAADIRAVMDTLAAAYHGRGAIELGDPFQVLVATVISQRTREEQTTIVTLTASIVIKTFSGKGLGRHSCSTLFLWPKHEE